MDSSDRDWWAKRRLTYNLVLVGSGFAAFAAMIAVGEAVCVADPDYEFTVFTVAFQAVGYAIAMAIANVLYGLGPAVERWFQPSNLVLYRRSAFGVGATLSAAAPLLV